MAELTPIEAYRAQWKPDEAEIANLESLIAKAERDGDHLLANAYHSLLMSALIPPNNVPIKNLTVTDCHYI